MLTAVKLMIGIYMDIGIYVDIGNMDIRNDLW